MLRLLSTDTTTQNFEPVMALALPESVNETVAFPRIDAYVAELRRSLVGSATPLQIVETCEEMAIHLRSSALALIELGESVDVAEREALDRFGAIATHRQTLRSEFGRNTRQTSRPAAFRFALVTFACVQLLDIVCASFQTAAIVNHNASTMEAMSLYWRYGGPLYVMFAPALLGGWLVGRQTRSLAVGATLRAIPCLIAALLLGMAFVFGAPALLSTIVRGDSPTPIIVDLLVTLTLYNIVRYPVAVMTAWIAGRRRSALQAKVR